MTVRNEVRRSRPGGYTMQEVVDLLHEEYDWSTVLPTCRPSSSGIYSYKEVVELADVLGYDLIGRNGGQV